VSYLWRPQLADPGDELVLETAVNARAELIASFDLRHLAKAAARFGIDVARSGIRKKHLVVALSAILAKGLRPILREVRASMSP